MEKALMLGKYFVDSGKTKQYLCHKLVVSRPRLDTILLNPSTATFNQAVILGKELGINSKKDMEFIFLP